MNKRWMGLVALTAAILFSGCGGTSALKVPEKVGKEEKIKIYVYSHTSEKFANIEPFQAIWNGIEPRILAAGKILQCDFTPETVLVLDRLGYEIVTDPSQADYRIDTEVLACASRVLVDPDDPTGSSALYGQRMDVPFKQKPLYLDLKDWVESGEAPEVYRKILARFDTDPTDALLMFDRTVTSAALRAMSDRGYWPLIVFGSGSKQIARYDVLYPRKYKGLTEEGRRLLMRWAKGVYRDGNETVSYHNTSGPVGFANIGSSLMRGGHTGAGGAFAALGVAMVLFSESPPQTAMRYRITRMSDKKSATLDEDFMMHYRYELGSPFGHNALDEVEDALDELFDKINDL